MTKPQFSAEPSMEDILASIRKMISEERLGPRPIPDQISRSPFGESSPATQRPASPEPRSERAPAERVGPSAGPSAGQNPSQAAGQAPAPSFSSLSDALNAAVPEQRRTLEQKIADMLESGGARPASPVDSLAVFSASRPAPALSIDPAIFGPMPRNGEPQAPAPQGAAPERVSARKSPPPDDIPRAARPESRSPEAPLNGAGRRREEVPARPMPSPVTPKVVGPASVADTKPVAESKPAAEPRKAADSQRIIAMPTRPGATPGAGQPAAASPAGPYLNGANVAPLGPRPVGPGGPGPRSAHALREPDAPSDAEIDTKITARSAGDEATAKPADAMIAKSSDVRGTTEDAIADELGKVDPIKIAREAATLREDAAKPHVAPVAETPLPADAAREPVFARAPREPDRPARPFAADSAAKSVAELPFAPTTPAPEPTIAATRAPSDALVDAVVALVHKEPDTMSVFTSGSAFIHGVAAPDHAKPGPNAARKLDRSAAELLRPMLRQWLSENMPRIVEEALRSELMSSQSPPKDKDEA